MNKINDEDEQPIYLKDLSPTWIDKITEWEKERFPKHKEKKEDNANEEDPLL